MSELCQACLNKHRTVLADIDHASDDSLEECPAAVPGSQGQLGTPKLKTQDKILDKLDKPHSVGTAVLSLISIQEVSTARLEDKLTSDKDLKPGLATSRVQAPAINYAHDVVQDPVIETP